MLEGYTREPRRCHRRGDHGRQSPPSTLVPVLAVNQHRYWAFRHLPTPVPPPHTIACAPATEAAETPRQPESRLVRSGLSQPGGVRTSSTARPRGLPRTAAGPAGLQRPTEDEIS
jgi:hypothetical protein